MISLFLIGIAMGIADLIPGVSGGTIAFVTGIYDEMLASLKTLQLHSLRGIAWRFLLPLGAGILTAVLLIARLFYYLLNTYPTPLFAFFFGLILASALFCAPKAALKRPSHALLLLFAGLIAFLLAGAPEIPLFSLNFIGLFSAGMLAAFAMLLPGLSGSYLLQIFGIYPLLLAALNAPSTPGAPSMLLSVAFGVAFGVILFSRVVSALLHYLPTWTHAALVGLMLGGTRAIWPFQGEWVMPLLFAALGFSVVILLEVKVKTRSIERNS